MFLSCCIVYRCVLLFSFSRCSATFCLPVLTSGPFFQCEALFLHLYLRRWPHLFCWGFVLMLYQGFVLVFYIEASSSYFILRLWPRIILRLCPHILFWGFVLIFYCFVLSWCVNTGNWVWLSPLIYYWGFVLLWIRPLLLLRIYPYNTFWGFVLWLLVDSSTLAFGVVVNLLFIYYFGIYRGVFCVDLMSDRLSLPHFYCVI